MWVNFKKYWISKKGLCIVPPDVISLASLVWLHTLLILYYCTLLLYSCFTHNSHTRLILYSCFTHNSLLPRRLILHLILHSLLILYSYFTTLILYAYLAWCQYYTHDLLILYHSHTFIFFNSHLAGGDLMTLLQREDVLSHQVYTYHSLLLYEGVFSLYFFVCFSRFFFCRMLCAFFTAAQGHALDIRTSSDITCSKVEWSMSKV